MKKFCFVVLISVIYAAAAFAQEAGGVKGKVRTSKGEGIPGVTITARQNSEDVRSVTSDSKGNFELNELQAGLYNIVFSKSGYSSGLIYNVEIKRKKTNNLGDRLVLTIDQGTQIIIKGTVFDQDGRSVPGAKIEIEKISGDGSTQKIGSVLTSYGGEPTARGEFTFRFSEGAAKFRVTASVGGATASKEIEVSNAAIYRLAITLKVEN